MDKQTVFQSGSTAIDLDKVVAFVKSLHPADAPAADVQLTVYMVDGSERTVHGEGDSGAFAQAMDNHLGMNRL